MEEKLLNHFLTNKKVSTDSRNIENNTIFFGLKGENFNGSKYAGEAIKKGAAFAVVDETVPEKNDKYIVTKDPLITLQELALYYRKTFDIPLIAITGTNGKTTTKELIYSVLKQKYRTFATIGNLNNHIGVPLSLLSFPKETEIAIIEMGANHIGEIADLCDIALPTHGIITNIGKAHLEGFGSFKGVIKAKTELYSFLKKHHAAVFVNADDELLMKQSKDIKRILYSCDNKKSGLEIIRHYPFLQLIWHTNESKYVIESQLFGDYNLSNIMAAISIGKYFGVEDNDIIKGIEVYQPENLRSQVLKKNTNTIVLDAYNANPSSMKLAIENFTNFSSPSRILILGDMLELGAESEKEHINTLKSIDKKLFKEIILVGECFKRIADPLHFKSFKHSSETAEYLKKNPVKKSAILLKGSRKIQLEKLLDVL